MKNTKIFQRKTAMLRQFKQQQSYQYKCSIISINTIQETSISLCGNVYNKMLRY